MRRFFERRWAGVTDGATCLLLNAAQWRHRRDVCSRAQLEDYIVRCEAMDRAAFYAAPPLVPIKAGEGSLRWPSPHPSGYPVNDTASAVLLPGPCGWKGPVVLILHALMSVNDTGYRLLASRFHALGWSAVLMHLPYHYERRPRGYLNGELAITANLVRNGEGLRQGVSELRQLMQWLRDQGATGFGLMAASYGAWTGALLATLEPGFRFLALMQPIADVEHAIWQSPAGRTLRRLLAARGIDSELTRRHAHLTSPLHRPPQTPPDRVLLVCGAYDAIAPPETIERLSARWDNAPVLACRQGHFGYAVQRETFRAVQDLLG